MSAAPLLVTERLELWRPARDDLAGIHALTADPETRRFLGPDAPCLADDHARLLRNAGSWALHGYGNFMVRLRGQAQIIGGCGVFHSWRGLAGHDDVPEAGWIVHRNHWRQGIAAEAMRAALAWFDATHGPRRIACMIEQGNTASQVLAARLGFTECGRHDDFEGSGVVLYERLAGG